MRRILRATAIMGSSSVVTIIAGIVRVKIMAVLLGPTGVGLYGLYSSFITVSSIVAGLGTSTPSISAISGAKARVDNETPSLVRFAVEFCAIAAGLAGALALVVFRDPLARFVFSGAVEGVAIGWMGLGVFAMTVSAAQVAVLNGLRRLGDMALVAIFGATASTIVGTIAVWQFGNTGVIIAVLTMPVASLAASTYLLARLKLPKVAVSRKLLFEQALKLVRPGLVFMIAALVSLAVPFIIRVIITNRLGLPFTGYFQAAWSVSMLYLGFILSAMGADYFPRLSEVSTDKDRTTLIFNEQVEAALLFAAPIIIGMLTLAPLVVRILYSNAFTESIGILRWQLLGDIFKVVGWSMSIILLAQNRQLEFFAVEVVWAVSYIGILYLGLGAWGVEAAGVGFLISYIIYAGCLWIVLFRTVRVQTRIMVFLGIVLAVGVTTDLTAPIKYWGLAIGLSFTVGLAIYSIKTTLKRVRTQDVVL